MNNGTTIIAVGTTVKGEVYAKSNLHIDGIFEGTIKSDSNISIGQGGKASGEIVAEKLIVSGHFKGKVDCDTVEIMPNGRIDGEVITNELVIEREGFFVGESRIKNETASKPEETPLPASEDTDTEQ